MHAKAHHKIHPKTNISRAYYKHLINTIEHDPLVRHTTLTIACMCAAMCVLLGTLLWYAKSNPGNLVQAQATITNVSSDTHQVARALNFITFTFNTRAGEQKSVRQQVLPNTEYAQGQTIRIGYHPKNPNFARNLSDIPPPTASLYLWATPFVLMVWFTIVALFRYEKRQQIIWDAAEAADVNE